MNTDNIATLEPQELLALEEAAEFLCVSKSTMYRLLDQGKLQGMKAGKQWRFRKADLLDYMQRDPAALALGNLPMHVLDAELDFSAEELARAGAAAAECDDPALEGEAGKIAQLARRMVWLLRVRKGSDLHLEPVFSAGEYCTLVRLRLDGVLHEIRRLPAALHQPLMLHWKGLAGLNRDERVRPQDGSVRLVFPHAAPSPDPTPFNDAMLQPLRVSIIPTVYGEKLAVRNIPTRIPSMADLEIEQTPLRQWIQHAHGLILVVGPTGSGKVTTTAACLRERISPGVNVMTVEDPTEYLLPGATQVHLDGISHAEGLRALWKQDPDIIYVGDITDPEEDIAQLTVLMAETGHLVFGVMHAYDPILALYQLLECGVKRSMLANNLIGCAAQCLMPKLCTQCKTPAELRPSTCRRSSRLPSRAISPFRTARCSIAPPAASNAGRPAMPGVLPCMSSSPLPRRARPPSSTAPPRRICASWPLPRVCGASLPTAWISPYKASPRWKSWKRALRGKCLNHDLWD